MTFPSQIKSLAQSAKEGDIENVKLLLEAKAHPDDCDSEGEPALHAAILGAHDEIVLTLLARRADPNLRAKKDGATALMKAVNLGLQRITEFLLSFGASPNEGIEIADKQIKELRSKTSNKLTKVRTSKQHLKVAYMPAFPLALAICNRNVNLALMLLDNKPRSANPNQLDDGITPIFLAIIYSLLPVLVNLIDHGVSLGQACDINTLRRAAYHLSPIAKAIGRLCSQSYLVCDLMAELDAQGVSGFQKILDDFTIATKKDIWEIYVYTSKQAFGEWVKTHEINLQNPLPPLNKPFLFGAIHRSEPDFQQRLRHLIELKADINQQDFEGNTLVHASTVFLNDVKMVERYINITKLLIELKVDPDITNLGGETPLYRAVAVSNDDVISVLLEAKASPWKVNPRTGHTPLSLACLRGNDVVVRQFLALNPDFFRDEGRGKFHGIICLFNGILLKHQVVIDILLEYGVDIQTVLLPIKITLLDLANMFLLKEITSKYLSPAILLQKCIQLDNDIIQLYEKLNYLPDGAQISALREKLNNFWRRVCCFEKLCERVLNGYINRGGADSITYTQIVKLDELLQSPEHFILPPGVEEDVHILEEDVCMTVRDTRVDKIAPESEGCKEDLLRTPHTRNAFRNIVDDEFLELPTTLIDGWSETINRLRNFEGEYKLLENDIQELISAQEAIPIKEFTNKIRAFHQTIFPLTDLTLENKLLETANTLGVLKKGMQKTDPDVEKESQDLEKMLKTTLPAFQDEVRALYRNEKNLENLDFFIQKYESLKKQHKDIKKSLSGLESFIKDLTQKLKQNAKSSKLAETKMPAAKLAGGPQPKTSKEEVSSLSEVKPKFSKEAANLSSDVKAKPSKAAGLSEEAMPIIPKQTVKEKRENPRFLLNVTLETVRQIIASEIKMDATVDPILRLIAQYGLEIALFDYSKARMPGETQDNRFFRIIKNDMMHGHQAVSDEKLGQLYTFAKMLSEKKSYSAEEEQKLMQHPIFLAIETQAAPKQVTAQECLLELRKAFENFHLLKKNYEYVLSVVESQKKEVFSEIFALYSAAFSMILVSIGETWQTINKDLLPEEKQCVMKLLNPWLTFLNKAKKIRDQTSHETPEKNEHLCYCFDCPEALYTEAIKAIDTVLPAPVAKKLQPQELKQEQKTEAMVFSGKGSNLEQLTEQQVTPPHVPAPAEISIGSLLSHTVFPAPKAPETFVEPQQKSGNDPFVSGAEPVIPEPEMPVTAMSGRGCFNIRF